MQKKCYLNEIKMRGESMSSNRSSKLVKNTAILTFGKICTRGIMFIMTPLFTRWISQSDYGTFDLIVTYITFLMPIITLECAEAVFRHLLDAKQEIQKKRIITNCLTNRKKKRNISSLARLFL